MTNTASETDVTVFTSSELNDLRRGFFSQSLKAKFTRRCQSFNRTVLMFKIAVGVLASITIIPILCLLIFSFAGGPARTVAAIALFFLFIIVIFGSFLLKAVSELRSIQRQLAADLSGQQIHCQRGLVKIGAPRFRNSRKYRYSINNTEVILQDEIINLSVYQEFISVCPLAPVRETSERYCFYYLPESKALLHFERV